MEGFNFSGNCYKHLNICYVASRLQKHNGGVQNEQTDRNRKWKECRIARRWVCTLALHLTQLLIFGKEKNEKE